MVDDLIQLIYKYLSVLCTLLEVCFNSSLNSKCFVQRIF